VWLLYWCCKFNIFHIYIHSLQTVITHKFSSFHLSLFDLSLSENCPLLDVLTFRGLPFVAQVSADFLLQLKSTRTGLLLLMQKAPPPLQKLKDLYFIARDPSERRLAGQKLVSFFCFLSRIFMSLSQHLRALLCSDSISSKNGNFVGTS
jgi:hypothetical protein